MALAKTGENNNRCIACLSFLWQEVRKAHQLLIGACRHIRTRHTWDAVGCDGHDVGITRTRVGGLRIRRVARTVLIAPNQRECSQNGDC
jgi:hypothetical protein